MVSQIPIFKTEQGRYLASSKWLDFLTLKQPLNLPSALGEPLVKGLTEIAENRPTDPISYLAEFLQNYIKMRDNKNDLNPNENEFSTKTNQKPLKAIQNGYNNSLQSPTINLPHNNEPIEPNTSSSEIPSKASEPIKATDNSTNHLDDQQAFGEFDESASPNPEDRDEHGQSMLHFACARSHGRNALSNLIDESNIDITYRDELYRTARDVSLQANQPGNAKEIDRYVISLAAIGDIKPFEYFAVSGYDHILDVSDDEGNTINDVVRARGHSELHSFLDAIREFEETREELHKAVREGNMEKVQEITAMANATLLIRAKNYFGRTALHIAILKEHEEIIEYFVNLCQESLKIGDNLERTPLHYAMGINSVETISRILIRKGAKRTSKDLKGRQPSYYFMNKADIIRLQEEEEVDR